MRVRDVDFLENSACLQLDVSETRSTLLPRAFDHFAVEKDEPLGKRIRVVRPDIDDLVAEFRDDRVCRGIVTGRRVCMGAAVAL